MSGAQVMKRIPRIKFPNRRASPSGSEPQKAAPLVSDSVQTFFSGSKASKTLGGKASEQPPRTPVSKEEIEAILDRSHNWSRRKLRTGTNMLKLNLFSLRVPWGSITDSEEKLVELSAAELESLRTELADIEEKEAHSKAQLEHVDEVLRSARLSGFLYNRTRWMALPGEPPPLDDSDVDDWLPRFLVLQGTCMFFYLFSADLSPQDSTLLSDIVELGPLPSFTRDGEGTRYAFYILTRQGLRYECSSVSQIQLNSWLSALRVDCKLENSDAETTNVPC